MRRLHFLELDPDNVDDTPAPYAVLPVPYERSTSFARGTARAPAAILKASQQLELFDEEFLEPFRPRVQTLDPPELKTVPDEEALDRIRRAAISAFSNSPRFLLSLGGEHTITAPLVAAAEDVHGKFSVLQMDAHLDLRGSYMGNRLSHACVMRRVMEMGLPVVHVGTRSLCEEEYELVISSRSKVFWARSIAESDDASWIEEVIAQLAPKVYITIDCDCLDPSLMPGTGAPEPGGMSWQNAARLLRSVCAARNVISADIVELMPIPGSVVSEYTAARLAAKLMIYHTKKREI